MSEQPEVMSAGFTMEYAFKRSLGPVLSRFFTGLRDRRIEGVRTQDGRVLFPPSEYDPKTGASLDQFVPLTGAGRVTTWTWVAEPRPKHPLDRPFAFALIQLDGADTPFLHAVDAGDESKLSPGMRVQVRWAEERGHGITDIACFEPEDSTPKSALEAGMEQAIEMMPSPVRLDFRILAGADLARFLNGLKAGKIIGRKCDASNRVYCPPREGSPTHGTDMGEYVDVPPTGTLTTFCIVNVKFEGQVMETPYVYGAILLDGTDTPFLHLVNATEQEARMGMRLKAVWKPEQEREGSFTDIRYFESTGEPDADHETYREYQ